MGVRLRNIGTTGWRSWDVDGTELLAMPGQEVEMSEARAEKVLADYPRGFERVEEPPAREVEVDRHEEDTSAEEASVLVEVAEPEPVSESPTTPDPPAGPVRGRRGRRKYGS